jgi:cell division protein FtsB
MIKNAFWLFIFSIILFLLFLPSYTQLQDLRQKNLEYDKEIKLLREKRVKLEKERLLLENDPVYLEKVAREKMGLIKDGEVVYKITPVKPQ